MKIYPQFDILLSNQMLRDCLDGKMAEKKALSRVKVNK